MSQIELEKIADHFDRDKDGYIDLSEISSILRGLRRARSLAKKQPISDSEKIDYEVAIIELLPQLPALFMSSQIKFQTTFGYNNMQSVKEKSTMFGPT